MKLEQMENLINAQIKELEESKENKRAIDDIEGYRGYVLTIFNTLLQQVKKAQEEDKKKGTANIEVNNGCKLIVELKDNRLIFTKLDEKGNIERADSVLDGEIVLLYDYILHQRDNDLELF